MDAEVMIRHELIQPGIWALDVLSPAERYATALGHGLGLTLGGGVMLSLIGGTLLAVYFVGGWIGGAIDRALDVKVAK